MNWQGITNLICRASVVPLSYHYRTKFEFSTTEVRQRIESFLSGNPGDKVYVLKKQTKNSMVNARLGKICLERV